VFFSILLTHKLLQNMLCAYCVFALKLNCVGKEFRIFVIYNI